MVPGYPVSYGENTQMVPRDLLARYSGTMQRIFCGRAAAAAAAAAVPHRSSRQYELVQLSATAVGSYSQSISSSRTLLATVLSSGKNTTTDSMRACMNVQKTQFLL